MERFNQAMHWLRIMPLWVSMVSGISSIIREVNVLYSGEQSHPVTWFWASVWICFVVSSWFAYWLFYRELRETKSRRSLQIVLDPNAFKFSQVSIEGPGFCRFNGTIAVMFENADLGTIYARLRLSVCERLAFGRRREVVSPQSPVVVWQLDRHEQEVLIRGIPIPGRYNSEPYSFLFVFELPESLGAALDKNHFLRIGMEATNQSPTFLDADVDWDTARKNDQRAELKSRNARDRQHTSLCHVLRLRSSSRV